MAGSREQTVTNAFDEIFNDEAEAPDVLGRVVARDRRKSGRGQDSGTPEEAAPAAELASLQDYKLTSQPVSLSAPTPAEAEPPAEPAAEVEPILPPRETTPAVSSLADRIALASTMAKSPTVTVSFRMPGELNEWLDAYVHESWRDKVKKQDLLTEAVRMLIARRGKAGEPTLPTELLPEEVP